MQVFRSKGTFLFQLLALSWTKTVPASHIKLGRPIHRKPVVLEEIKQNFAKDLRQKHVPIVSFITKFVTRTEGRVPLTCSWILDLSIAPLVLPYLLPHLFLKLSLEKAYA